MIRTNVRVRKRCGLRLEHTYPFQARGAEKVHPLKGCVKGAEKVRIEAKNHLHLVRTLMGNGIHAPLCGGL